MGGTVAGIWILLDGQPVERVPQEKGSCDL